MSIPRGLLVRNTDTSSPLRRREFSFPIYDDGGRAAVEPVQDAVGDVLLGFPEPDADNTYNVFVVDQVFLQVSEKGGNGDNDYVTADVFAGPGGTSMLSALPKIDQRQTFPCIAQVGGTNATGLVNPVLKAASSCEVPAGTGLYADITVVNDQTTPFGSITLVVSGFFKDEF